MSGYYTVKLLGAERIAAAERMRLETAYAAQLEGLAGGQAALIALCEAARAQPQDGPEQLRLRDAARRAEAVVRHAATGWPEGARFSLSLWTAQDL